MKCTERDNVEKDKNAGISEKLQQYIQTLQFFDDSLDDYIYIYDLTAERVFFTDKIRIKYPLPPAGDDGNDFGDWNDIVYPKDRKLMDHYRNLLIKEEINSFDIAYRILDREGNKVWVRVKGTLREKENDQSSLIVGRISEMAQGGMVDSVTGLCSTDQFLGDFKHQLENSEGYLMILDIDNFKNINITQGRASGNAVLKKVADTLDEHTEYPMEIYRMDGDRFAVIFIQKQGEDVQKFYNSIRASLENVCTVSAGAVYYSSGEAEDSSAVYMYAETALDQAKKEGKDKMIFFSEADFQKNREQVELLNEIKNCIQHDCKGFSLNYQPQISSQDYRIYGVEALLRYQSPSKGIISPAEFIPLLEQTRLICPVGYWVLKTAAAQCKEWREHIPGLHMSVNISHVQLQQDGITDVVLDVLKEAQLPGDALTLEVTESMQLQNYLYFNRIFYKWKQHGIKIAIDDFGTGYSSLSYLKRIEIDEVKIDRCFVDHVQYNAYNYRLLSNMIELAHSAKIRVCCEGVETSGELMALQELHTDIMQGFFFAKPYSKEVFEQVYICTESDAYRERQEREAQMLKWDSSESKELLQTLRNEEIVNIVESMDEVIYVSDVDTYELYYLNAAGRRMSGVYDYKGCKCYKVLQGKDEPCKFCTNAKLCKERFYVWELDNTFVDRHFILKDKLIPWQGKMARVEMAIDVTEKEIVSQSIRNKLHFERAIVEACRILASESNSDKSAYNVLKIIGEFCQGDRAYILKPCSGENQWDLNWEWCTEEQASLKDHFPVTIAEECDEHVQNRIIAPIIRNHKNIGLVVVDNPQFKDDGNDLVKTIAHFLGYSMIGAETQEKLNALLESQCDGLELL